MEKHFKYMIVINILLMIECLQIVASQDSNCRKLIRPTAFRSLVGSDRSLKEHLLLEKMNQKKIKFKQYSS